MKAYMSHSIRGKMGVDATIEYMDVNNKKAIAFANKLREVFTELNIHVPGEYEEFVEPAYRKGHLTERQILDVDCDIISRSDFIIIYSPDDYVSRGMQVEIDYATLHNIPIISAIDGTPEEYFKHMCEAINCHLIST